MIEKVNIKEKFSLFHTYWDPKIVGKMNKQFVKLVKFQGEFVWHQHENEDELFMVVKGSFEMFLREKVITMNEGEFIIIPKGTEHRPIAKEEVHVLLFEPSSVINTGSTHSDLTITDLEKN